MGGILLSMRGGKAVGGICASTRLAVLVCLRRTESALREGFAAYSAALCVSGRAYSDNVVVQDVHRTHLHAQGCCATGFDMHRGCSFKRC